MSKIFIRVKKDDFNPKLWMITVQTEGYPETAGFLDDDLTGLGGSKDDMFKLAEKLKVLEQEANPDKQVIVKR